MRIQYRRSEVMRHNEENAVILLSERPTAYQLQLKDRALASTEEGITISDNLQPDNPIVYANLGFERLTGYDREDVLGNNCRFLQGEETDEATIEEIRRAIREETSCSVEILNYRKNGTTFWNQLSITPIRDESGRVTNFLGIQSDITDRKNYENELKNISQKLEQKNRQMQQDLEDARELQMSMLPKDVPKMPFLEIAVAMHTAQEVGGDYYDFYRINEELTFVIGDATGHGLKAGTMVTATKTLFNNLARVEDPRLILKEMSASLNSMGFRNMFMAMLVAKITTGGMSLSSAGMPFTYVYKFAQKRIAEIELKGLPLGSFYNYPYELRHFDIHKGDTFLFMSDGLAECFNADNEMFGNERVKAAFKEVAGETPGRIIRHLTETTRAWMGNGSLHDDMTMVVMKCK